MKKINKKVAENEEDHAKMGGLSGKRHGEGRRKENEEKRASTGSNMSKVTVQRSDTLGRLHPHTREMTGRKCEQHGHKYIAYLLIPFPLALSS